MNQLTLSFHEEILLQLKAKNWEFKSYADSLNKISNGSKFIRLDMSSENIKTGQPGVKPGHSTKGKSLKKRK